MANQERKVELRVGVDATEARQGFNEVKTGARDMAQAVVSEGNKAGKAVSTIGDGGQQSAQKTESATRSMIQSIQRATAAMEAGSKSSSQYYEALANQRGVSVETLKPYLAQLESVEAKQKQASVALNSGAASMDRIGMSAKQSAAAMRGVPAQLTDIFVSLQGGQQPMTVLLQQGGQLKDMFGGIAPAARALGSALVGMLNPLTLGAAAVGALYLAYRAGSSEGEEFRKTLILTGGAIGQNADQLQAMSARIGAVVGTQRQAAEAVNEFAKSAKVGAGNLEQFAAAAVRWQDATGTAVGETVKQFEALGKSPLEASLKLNESMNYLTESVYKQIKALQDAGKETEAASVAQKAYADALETRAPKMVANLGTVEAAWKKVKEASLGALDWTLNIGRDATPESRLKELQAEYARLSQSASSAHQDRAKAVLAQITGLQDLAKWQGAVARNDAENAKAAARAAEIDSYTGDKSRKTRAQQMQDELTKERGVYEARKADAAGNAKALVDIESAYHTAVSNIRDKYKDKTAGGGISATDTELASLRGRLEVEKQLATQLASSGGAVEKLNEGEKLSLQYSEKLTLAKGAETRARLTALKTLADELGAQQRASTGVQEFAKQQQQYADAQFKLVESIHAKAAAMEAENAVYGLGKDAVEQMTIARLEERKAVLQGFDGSEEQIKLIEQEIDARKRLMEASSQRESLDANKKAAEEAAREWKRQADDISRSLTDALMRGFESGKDFAQNLASTLKNMFQTLVLRPVVQAVMAPAAGTMGYAGQANAASGGGRNGFGNVTSLLGDSLNGSLGGMLVGNSVAYGAAVPGLTVGSQQAAMLAAQTSDFGIAGLATTASSAGYAGATGIGSWVNGLSNVGGLYTAGAGIIGGLAGGALFGNKGYSSLGGSLGAAGGLALGASTAVSGTAIGASLGSWAGPVGALAGMVIGAALGSLIGGGETRYGASYAVDSMGQASKFAGPSGGDRAAEQVTTAIESTYTSMRDIATKLGGSTAALGQFKASYEVSPNKGNSFVAAGFGDGWYPGRTDLKGEKDASKVMEAFELQLQRSLIEGLKQSNLEKPFADYLSQIDAYSLTSADAQAVLSTLDGLKSFSEAVKAMPFKGFADLSAAAALGLAKAAGGMDALVGSLTTYYQAFYSTGEQQKLALEQLTKQFTAVGVAMPDTKDGFRALMEGIDLTSESGQKLYASLLQIAPAFAQVTDAMAAFGKRVADFQQSLRLGDLSTLTPEQQYAEAKRQYDATSAAALSGDSEAQAQWTQIAQAFLEASRGFFASGAQYGADFAAVQGFRPNGSHANGLAYVPFDGYVAELHQGERVLTRAESASYSGPDWSKYGRGESAALVAEIRSLSAQVVALKESVRQVEQVKEAHAEARHAEVLAVQSKQARLQQQLVDK